MGVKNAYMSYLGTSFTGKLTGMRGNIIIIDDPIKNAEEAVNEKVKQGHFDFYKKYIDIKNVTKQFTDNYTNQMGYR